jgi:hypothetical protein
MRSASGTGVARRVKSALVTAPIGPSTMGVVFNHDMQQTGYVTGEISFKLRPNISIATLAAAGLPTSRHLVAADIYVIQTTTPAQFLDTLKKLQVRKELAWVEPVVTYGGN